MVGKDFLWLLSALLTPFLTSLVSYLWVPERRPLVSPRVLAGPGLHPPLGRFTVLGWWGVGCWDGGSYSVWTGSDLGEAWEGHGRVAQSIVGKPLGACGEQVPPTQLSAFTATEISWGFWFPLWVFLFLLFTNNFYFISYYMHVV